MHRSADMGAVDVSVIVSRFPTPRRHRVRWSRLIPSPVWKRSKYACTSQLDGHDEHDYEQDGGHGF